LEKREKGGYRQLAGEKKGKLTDVMHSRIREKVKEAVHHSQPSSHDGNLHIHIYVYVIYIFNLMHLYHDILYVTFNINI
jgi:hypothetical protein